MHRGGCGYIVQTVNQVTTCRTTFGSSTGTTPVESCISQNWTLHFFSATTTSTNFLFYGAEQHTQPRLKPHTPSTLSCPENLGKQSTRSFLMDGNNAVTHPKDDGIEEQQEFEENVGESVTVSDLIVAGHRV